MNNEKIEGIGTIHGGDYNDIIVDGMGKLKGTVTAVKVVISGTFKAKGRLTAEEIYVDGFARIFKRIKAKKLIISGTLKLRHADVNADTVHGDGLLTSTGAICADEIRINGYCTVKKMMGDNISIHNDFTGINKLVKRLGVLTYLYFGRSIHFDHSLIDQIECTTLRASGIKAKTVHAGHVELGKGCIIDKLYCEGTMTIDPSCRIRKIYSKNKIKKFNQKGSGDMADLTIKKILDLYKNATINEEEAELMLNSVYHGNPTGGNSSGEDNIDNVSAGGTVNG
jgi:cytoskeletal protein CcmA (bactofilin family)